MAITFGLGTVTWRQLKEYLDSNMFPKEFLDHPVAVVQSWNGEFDEVFEAGIDFMTEEAILSKDEPFLKILTINS